MPVDIFNPLHYMKQDEYARFWIRLFNTVLYGFWGRFFFVILIALAFWVGVRQRNPTLAAICLVLAAIIAYGGGLMDMITRFTG